MIALLNLFLHEESWARLQNLDPQSQPITYSMLA